MRRLKELGVAVYFEKEAIDTLEAKGEVLMTIMATIAQQESQSISQNIQMGIRYRMQQGKGMLNTAYFLGFVHDREEDRLAIVPKAIFSLAQLERQRRSRYQRNPQALRRSSQRSLDGLVVCARCGQTLKICLRNREDRSNV